jgi:hypothetical protein
MEGIHTKVMYLVNSKDFFDFEINTEDNAYSALIYVGY